MPRLSQITRQHPVSVSFEHEGESLTIVFDRNKVTPAWIRAVTTELERGEASPAAEGLVAIMISWDLLDDNEQSLAPSAAILDQLPLDLLVKLHEAIGEAAAPGSEEGNVSSQPSSRPASASTENSQTFPNGQAPSPLPTPSASQFQT